MPVWTPARGAAQLAEEFGREEAIQLLAGILRKDEIPSPLFLRVMSLISNAQTLTMAGPHATPGWHEWPETWAARALGYLGEGTESALLVGADHPHWRVRRQVIRSLGWVGGLEALAVVRQAAFDEDRRVREQSVVSEIKILSRLG